MILLCVVGDVMLLGNVPGQQRSCGKCETILDIYPTPSSRGRGTSSGVCSQVPAGSLNFSIISNTGLI